jgi:hypothetical protein
MPSVDDYINKIKRDDPHLTSLNLANKKLTDADLNPLFKAFDAKPEVKNRIKVIFLNGNNIQYLRLFGFRKLVLLHIANCGFCQNNCVS